MSGRKIDSTPRKENTREKKLCRVVFAFDNVKKHFEENISDIKNKFQISETLLQNNSDSAKDIWRSQIVFLDSAVDYYIHEVVKYGMVKIFNGDWTETDDYKSFKVSLSFALNLAKNPENSNSFLDEVDELNQYSCFMQFYKISKILKLIGIHIPKTNENKINELYKRRNQIAHQSDRIARTGKKELIDQNIVEGYLELVQEFVGSINILLENKDTQSN